MRLLYSMTDPRLNYGREEVLHLARQCGSPRRILDIAAGSGEDLLNIRKCHPHAHLIAFDFIHQAEELGFERHRLDLERDPFPAAAGDVDLVIANQILEHAKELFWIFDQMLRAVRTQGHLIIGVPNLASLHNRLLLAIGRQPTPIRSASAHVRGFTRSDLLDFMDSCYPGGLQLVDYRGSNFYPFPPAVARPLARAFPGLAWGNFYLFRVVRPYSGEFLKFPHEQGLETNFFTGRGSPQHSPGAAREGRTTAAS